MIVFTLNNMNIFFVSTDPEEAAEMMCDKHVVKMILETCQMLWTAYHTHNARFDWKLRAAEMGCTIYKATHVQHPSCIWVREREEHYQWIVKHLNALCKEYTIRYSKTHVCQIAAAFFSDHMPNFPKIIEERDGRVIIIRPYKHTTFFGKVDIPPNCSKPPICIKNTLLITDSLTESYREYYRVEKRRFATWKTKTPPYWF